MTCKEKFSKKFSKNQLPKKRAGKGYEWLQLLIPADIKLRKRTRTSDNKKRKHNN